MNTETNNQTFDDIELRLQRDAKKIAVSADDQLSLRISNQLHPRTTSASQSLRTRPWLGWGLATAAVMVLAIVMGRNGLESNDPLIEAPLAANLELNIDKALASRENDLRNELQKVQNDLERVESMLGLGGKALSK